MKPVGQMLHIPADPGGQRTVLIVLVHSGKVASLWVAAGPLRTTAEVAMPRDRLQPAAVGMDEINVHQMQSLPSAFRCLKILFNFYK